MNDDYRVGMNYSPAGDLPSPNSFLSTPIRNSASGRLSPATPRPNSPLGDLLNGNPLNGELPIMQATRQISRPVQPPVQRPITFAVCQLTEQLIDHFRKNQASNMGALREQLTGVNKLLQGNPRNFWAWAIAYRISTEFSPVQVLGKSLTPLDCLYRAHYHCAVAEGVAMIKERLELELNQTIAKRNRLEARKSERELAKLDVQAAGKKRAENNITTESTTHSGTESEKGAKKQRPLELT